MDSTHQNGRTESVLAVRHLMAAASRRGRPVDALVDRLGLTPSVEAEGEGRIPQALSLALWAGVGGAMPDPAFPVAVAVEADLRAHGNPLTFFCVVAPDVAGCIRRYVRHWPVGSQLIAWHVEAEPDGWCVVGVPQVPPSPARALAVEYLVADLVSIGRVAAEGIFAPSVVLPHDRPGAARAFQAVAGVPAQAGGDRVEIRIGWADLRLPMRRADEALSGFLSAQIVAAHEACAPPTGFRDRVAALVTPALAEGPPALDAVARRLAVSPATLQRRLREEGAGFREVVDAARRSTALRLLAAEGRPSEVAYEVGFSSQRAFCRAFRRWTGRSPGAWRAGAVG